MQILDLPVCTEIVSIGTQGLKIIILFIKCETMDIMLL